jgi:hypothetical protein
MLPSKNKQTNRPVVKNAQGCARECESALSRGEFIIGGLKGWEQDVRDSVSNPRARQVTSVPLR